MFRVDVVVASVLLCWTSAFSSAHIVHLERRRHVLPAKDSATELAAQPQRLLAHLFSKAVKEPLLAASNLVYVGNVTIGSPAQEYGLIFDTGSSDIWFLPNAEQAPPTQQLTAPVDIQYGIGEVLGSFWSEQVCLAAQPTTLCGLYPVMVPQKMADLEDFPADGILGLGLPGVAHTGVCYTAALQDVYHRPAMGVSLGDPSFVAFDELKEQLEMAQQVTGCPPHEAALANVVVYDGLISPGWWAVEASLQTATLPATRRQGIMPAMSETLLVTLLLSLSLAFAWACATSERIAKSLGLKLLYVAFFGFLFLGIVMPTIDNLVSLLFCFRGSEVDLHAPMLLDSGTSLLVLPRAVASDVAQAMLGVYSSTHCSWQNNIFLCDCEVAKTAAPLTITIGGVAVQLRADEMFERLQDTDLCYSGLQVGQSQFILGDTALRSLYVVHDIKFAQVHVFPRRKHEWLSAVEQPEPPILSIAAAVCGATVLGVAAVFRVVLRRRSKGTQENYLPLPGDARWISA